MKALIIKPMRPLCKKKVENALTGTEKGSEFKFITSFSTLLI